MGYDDRAMFGKTTTFYAESATGMAAQANRLGIFLHTYVERAGAKLWT
jgi:hypothetical protein